MLVCAVCGSPAPLPFRAPPQEGSPDLDGRPGEPARSTLPRWIQRCPGCGACAPDLTALPQSAAERVGGEAYRSIKSPFLRWAKLVEGTAVEAEALLHAAWETEDHGGDGSDLRRRAASLWPEAPNTEAELRLIDVWRRAGEMEAARARLDRMNPAMDDTVARIVAFERSLVAARDSGRHLLSSALRPPARTPHVAHGKRAVNGFWSRMFGAAR